MAYTYRNENNTITEEKRLKDINGLQVWKITDNKGRWNEHITYMLDTQEGDNINCFRTLKELREFAKKW